MFSSNVHTVSTVSFLRVMFVNYARATGCPHYTCGGAAVYHLHACSLIYMKPNSSSVAFTHVEVHTTCVHCEVIFQQYCRYEEYQS